MLLRLVVSLSLVGSFSLASSLTPIENAEVEARIARFYRDSSPEVMNQRIPKFSLKQNRYVSLHPELKGTVSTGNALLDSAGKKADPEFQKRYCEKFLKKYFPKLNCDKPMDSSVKPNDRVEDLVESWISDVSYDLNDIPTVGKAEVTPWSDDYWRTRWGLSSYRYSSGTQFPTYKEAISSYAQPLSWTNILPKPAEETIKEVVKWSPAEKYDLIVGDTNFTLTNEQKREGEESIGPDGNVEDWMGLCHGWAAAAVMVSRPVKPTKLTGAGGVSVEFYPNDIKALHTLYWSNANYDTNFIGGRCDSKKPEMHPNGRVKEQECFDNNPATFHLVLGNLIGKYKMAFLFDKTFDYEVWNQPVASYDLTYFSPLDPAKKSKKWDEVAVDYDNAFKEKDRFQKPLTRGGKGRRDKDIKKVVGVIATVVYISEITPQHTPNSQNDELVREVYTYDLELSEKNGDLIPTGGEWHTNLHPDFLWMTKKDNYATSQYDKVALNFEGMSTPTELVTENARKASADALPLCQVLKVLTKESSGMDYPCPTDN